jgi:nitrite reductase/ring-hydroxylating ferredoxin subunit
MAEKNNIPLCSLEELDNPGSRGIVMETQQGPLNIFLVRKGQQVYGYFNRCPHTGVNLDWLPDQFLDLSGGFIQCATHGALFRIEDGICVRGPCAGDCLKAIELRIELGEVVLSL